MYPLKSTPSDIPCLALLAPRRASLLTERPESKENARNWRPTPIVHTGFRHRIRLNEINRLAANRLSPPATQRILHATLVGGGQWAFAHSGVLPI
jgi:hypothetical protein